MGAQCGRGVHAVCAVYAHRTRTVRVPPPPPSAGGGGRRPPPKRAPAQRWAANRGPRTAAGEGEVAGTTAYYSHVTSYGICTLCPEAASNTANSVSRVWGGGEGALQNCPTRRHAVGRAEQMAVISIIVPTPVSRGGGEAVAAVVTAVTAGACGTTSAAARWRRTCRPCARRSAGSTA